MKTCTSCGCSKPTTDFYTRNARCKPCAKAAATAYYEANRQHVLDRMKTPEQRAVQRVRDVARYQRPERKKQMNSASTRYRTNNKERRKEICAKYGATPRGRAKAAAQAAKRRAATLRATPVWSNAALVNFIYATAQYLRQEGLDMHVDHVVPLVSKKVCGLHAHTNLQIILGVDNRAKWNTYWPNM